MAEMTSQTSLTSNRASSASSMCTSKRLLAVVVGVSVLAVVVGVAVGVPLKLAQTQTAEPQTNYQKAIQVLESFPLIDGHNDLSYQYMKRAENMVYSVNLNENLTGIWQNSHTDIPRLRAGRLGAQFWAIYASCDAQGKDALSKFLIQTDTIKKFVAKYPDTFKFVTTANGITEAFKEGKIGSLMGLEGGHAIDSSLSLLRTFYEMGARYMTITHSCNTPWADNWKMDETSEPEHNGLTDFGKTVIREMNRLGMLVDLSHVSKKTMIDALSVSVSPVIYSHSSAYRVCNHYRNVQDDVLNLTKTNGGVVMVNFYDKYINCFPSNQTIPQLSQVADHIDYIKNYIGVDYVGIGADYDGVETVPVGLEDVSTYPALYAELIGRGWTNEELEKLSGRNLIRVLKENEKIKAQKADLPPYEQLISSEAVATETCRT